MRTYATAQHLGDRSHQCDATAVKYLFEPVSYGQLGHGDRIQIPQMYHGHFIDWWWRIITVDRVDWIRDDNTALMLRLTEPLPCGDRFVLIAGRDMVDAGARRVVGSVPAPATRP